MKQKQFLRTISNFILAGALVASLSSVALAAPPAQSGGQGTGTNQGTGVGQNAGASQSASMTQSSNALACSQTYVVQQGDTLGAIASQFFPSGGGSDRIIQATNAAVGTTGNFTNISDPNLIVPGQTLCIPAAAGATANNNVAGGTTVQQQPNPTAGVTAGNKSTVNNTNNAVFNQMLTTNPDKGLLVVENLSGSDIIFDLTDPEPGTAWVGPNQQKEFLLMPGQHQYSGHQPLGDFAIGADQFQVKAGQITWLSCFKNLCQLAQSSMLPGQGQSGQMQQPQSQSQMSGNQQQSGQVQQPQTQQQTTVQQQPNPTAGVTAGNKSTVNNTNNAVFNQMLTTNPDKGLLVVENLSGSDIIFDLTDPEPGTAWVGPNQQKEFLLMPGQHQYSGHQPLGDFAIGADQFQVKAGQITWLSCFKNLCQLAQSSMLPGQGQSGQMQQPQSQSQMSGNQQQSQQPSNNSQ